MKAMLSAVLAMTLAMSECVPNPRAPDNSAVTDENKYWDGEVAQAVPVPATCGSFDDRRRLFKDYMSPKMMSIGDSLYNGVSSLHVNWWLAEWSTPVQVAIMFDLIKNNRKHDRKATEREFWAPQYPDYGKPIFGNRRSEVQVRQFGLDIDSLPSPRSESFNFNAELRQAARDLQYLRTEWRPDNHRYFADNLAFSGADTYDLLLSSATSLRNRLTRRPWDWSDAPAKKLGEPVENQIARLIEAPLPLLYLGDFASAFTDINAAFVLDPMKHPCIADLAPIDQVELRRPRRLLINIGSNNGIYNFALNGRGVDIRRPLDTFDDPRIKEWGSDTISIRQYLGPSVYQRHMQKIIDRLVDVPEIQYVYINGLMPPSRIGNLVPRGGHIDHWYYQQYELSFASERRTLVRGTDVREADNVVRNQNAALKTMIEAANRRMRDERGQPDRLFVYVDIDERSREWDHKHLGTDNSRVRRCARIGPGCNKEHGLPLSSDVYLDNFPLDYSIEAIRRSDGTLIGYALSTGGLFSLDNMHLTLSGYALLAEWVSAEIEKNEPGMGRAIGARGMLDPMELYVARNFRPYSVLRNGRQDIVRHRQELSGMIDLFVERSRDLKKD